jgi:hypothetical protein
MGTLETIFGTVVVLAGMAVIGALVVVLVAEVCAIRRTIEGVRDARSGGDPAQPTAEAHQCASGPEDSPDPVQ